MDGIKNNFLLMTLLRYGFHFVVFILFYLTVDQSYFVVQQFFVESLSIIHYSSSISVAHYVFVGLIFFSILCYWADYRIIRKNSLKEYVILYLLALDVFCLFLAVLIMISFNNVTYNKVQIADDASLNNIPVIVMLIGLKDWVFIEVSNKKNS